MRSRTRSVTVSALACAAMALAAPGVASAVPTPAVTPSGATLAAIQVKAAAAISARLTALNQAIPAVNANSFITSADKATLESTLAADVSGLTALGARIAADTTARQAASDAATIYTSYRVYALALPQVRYAEAVDDLTGTVLPRLTNAQTTLAGLLAGADASKDTPAVQAAMADLAARISAAEAATDGQAATVLGFTPAQYDANHALLDAPRQALVSARADVTAARADVATVLGALQ
jgi:hypothetical protein